MAVWVSADTHPAHEILVNVLYVGRDNHSYKVMEHKTYTAAAAYFYLWLTKYKAGMYIQRKISEVMSSTIIISFLTFQSVIEFSFQT